MGEWTSLCAGVISTHCIAKSQYNTNPVAAAVHCDGNRSVWKPASAAFTCDMERVWRRDDQQRGRRVQFKRNGGFLYGSGEQRGNQWKRLPKRLHRYRAGYKPRGRNLASGKLGGAIFCRRCKCLRRNSEHRVHANQCGLERNGCGSYRF